jgi:hypothetical protein
MKPMNLRTVLFTLSAVSLLPSFAGAQTQYHWEIYPKSHLKFEIPTTWTTEVKGDTLLATTPGVDMAFVAATGGLAEAANAEKAMITEIGKRLQGVKITSPTKPNAQHGLKGFRAGGSGKKDGADVVWLTYVLGDGKGHVMLTVGIFVPSDAALNQIGHVLDSIQPAT